MPGSYVTRIYIYEWNGFGIGSDLFPDISQKINGNFIVKEEGRGQVLVNSELCCGRSYIIFRRPNYVGEDKRISWGRDVLEISTLPLVREMWQLLGRVFFLVFGTT